MISRRRSSISVWLGILIAALAVATAAAALSRSARKEDAPAPTDAARLDAFWSWWRTASLRIAAALDEGRGESIVDELSARIHAIDARLAWETGPGLRGARHHLAVSSEGDLALRVLVERWLSRAPAPDAAWEYYPARQASPHDAKFSLSLHDAAGTVIEFGDVRVTFETDALGETLHVTFHHPALAKLPDGERTRATLLVLDNVLGEDAVERWVGGVRLSGEALPDGKPLEALTEAVAALAKVATGERYATIEGRTLSGGPMIAVANLALKRLDHLLMDHHLQIVIPFQQEAAQGMPTGEENGAINALEDELMEALGHEAVWVGHETGDGRRTIHLLVSRQGPAEARARAWASRQRGRRIKIDIRHDPGWEVLRRWR